MRYHIWTLGCQMNVADSQFLASELEKLGHRATPNGDEADIMIVNTCVVRQSAEDKGLSRLGMLGKIKEAQPDKVVGVMGCMVGVRDPLWMRQRLPYVDVFMPPSDPAPMVSFLKERRAEAEALELEAEARQQRDAVQDGELILPLHERGQLVSAHVPIVYGCSHACAFCIIPFRRGVERSRRVGEILAQVRSLAAQGVKEVTLLGQIVDRYGADIPDGPDLADLLRIVNDTAEEVGIERIRFLTSHPNWMTEKLLRAVAELPRVMPHIEVPIQAGDDEVLARMRRGYTADQYRKLVAKIRRIIPQVAIHTDIIVAKRARNSCRPIAFSTSSSSTRRIWRATARARRRSASGGCQTMCRTGRSANGFACWKNCKPASWRTSTRATSANGLKCWSKRSARGDGAPGRRRTSWSSLKRPASGRAGWRKSKSLGPVPGVCRRVCPRGSRNSTPRLSSPANGCAARSACSGARRPRFAPSSLPLFDRLQPARQDFPAQSISRDRLADRAAVYRDRLAQRWR